MLKIIKLSKILAVKYTIHSYERLFICFLMLFSILCPVKSECKSIHETLANKQIVYAKKLLFPIQKTPKRSTTGKSDSAKVSIMRAQTINYFEITFTAANAMPNPYGVMASKAGKIIWQINNVVEEFSEKQKQFLADGGIAKLEVRYVLEDDLDKSSDKSSDKFDLLKTYIGKPALYIIFTDKSVVNHQLSWQIVDIHTGKQIGVIGFNN